MDAKRNPFRFGQLVKGEDFCNRQAELNEIKTAIFRCFHPPVRSKPPPEK